MKDLNENGPQIGNFSIGKSLQKRMQKIFSPKFTYAAFQIRNRWMVDHAVRLIAVYNGTPGGTRNTLAYAQKKSIALRIIPG